MLHIQKLGQHLVHSGGSVATGAPSPHRFPLIPMRLSCPVIFYRQCNWSLPISFICSCCFFNLGVCPCSSSLYLFIHSCNTYLLTPCCVQVSVVHTVMNKNDKGVCPHGAQATREDTELHNGRRNSLAQIPHKPQTKLDMF